MKIYCVGCDKYMGEIRDASLRKVIHYLCDKCNTKRIASDMGKNNKKDDYSDYLKDLFGGRT